MLDALLDDYVERDMGSAELIAAGHDPALVERVIRLVDTAEYKRRQYPPGPKISQKNFGRDRRLPITNRWREHLGPSPDVTGRHAIRIAVVPALRLRDIQEVKPETYFCNHCDNVFKYVSPSRSGSPGGCELPVGGRPCGVPAIGRCMTCSRAYCGTHQAHEVNSVGIVFQTYRDWCVSCQQQRKADEKARAEAQEKRAQEERAAAAERIPGLIAQFRARPFSGAVSRDYVQRVAARHEIPVPCPQVQISNSPLCRRAGGQLYWTYYQVSYDNDPLTQKLSAWETGLTQQGQFVPMDTSFLHTWVMTSMDYELRAGQEVEICEVLERLLGQDSQAAEAVTARDARFNLTADGKVN